MRLALEWSSPQPSVSLQFPDQIKSTVASVERVQARHALKQVRDFLEASSVEPSSLDEIVVGCGPGNYSGMRMAIAIASGLAAPGATPVCAVSSGRALLWRALLNDPSRPVRLVGDARRGRCWTFRAERADTLEANVPIWQLVERDAVGSLDAGEEVRCLSSEPDRLPESICGEPAFPLAEDLLALSSAEGFVADALQPLYLHPPV